MNNNRLHIAWSLGLAIFAMVACSGCGLGAGGDLHNGSDMNDCDCFDALFPDAQDGYGGMDTRSNDTSDADIGDDSDQNCSDCNESGHCDGKTWIPGSVCMNGVCTPGQPKNCDDGNACTIDSCDAVKQCTYEAAPDGSKCSEGVCNGLTWTRSGKCLHALCSADGQDNCFDGLDCTNDYCSDLIGCWTTTYSGFCNIDNICYQDGERPEGNPCSFCNSTISDRQWSHEEEGILCGDGLACTNGYCGCAPDCSEKECGPDGCGGQCDPGCGDNEICESGSCCTLNYRKGCYTDGNLHWYDSCGIRRDFAQGCTCGCALDSCQCCPSCPNCLTAPTNNGCGGICPANCDATCFNDNCCEPDCIGRTCGDDGCGGICGSCQNGTVCDELHHECVEPCSFPEDLPISFGPAGIVNYKHIPANAGEKAACRDYTGDGVGDCGLTGLASQLNGPLQDQITDGLHMLVFEIDPSAAGGNLASFQLNFLSGSGNVSSGSTTTAGVYQSSYDPETCQPVNYVRNARISSGVLSAGPFESTMQLIMSDRLFMTFRVIDCYISASVTVTGSSISATNGLFSGILLREEWDAAIKPIEDGCDQSPVPAQYEDICSYLGVMKAASAMLFDLHRVSAGKYIIKDANNPGNASSWCKIFTLKAASLSLIPE